MKPIGNKILRGFLAPCVSAVLLLFGTVAVGFGEKPLQDLENSTPQAPRGLQQGPMQRITESVKPILRIKFDPQTKSISVDQTSWGPQKLAEERKKIHRNLLMDRGMDKALIEQMVAQMAQAQPASGPINKLFSRVRASGGMKSTFTSVSGSSKAMKCSSADLSCSMSVSASQFELRLVELSGPGRTLDIQSSTGFRMLLTGDSMLAMINQSESGVMGVLIDGDEVNSAQARDYYTFSKQNPELLTKIRALGRHAGVDFPPGINETVVKLAAIRMLVSRHDKDREALNGLIEQMNAPEFSVREQASGAVEKSFPLLESSIDRALKEDDLSAEARKRLEKIVRRQATAIPVDRRAEDCVKANRLLDSTGYILGLLEIAKANDRRWVTHHLAETTGLDFGPDVEKWKRWWGENAK